MPSSRDDFSSEVVRILRERVGSRCSNPGCGCATTGPNTNPEKATRIGVGAHITAAAPGGPRYNADLTPDQRSSIENGIWLCQNCGRLIDADAKAYPVEVLKAWKIAAEHRASMELEGSRPATVPHVMSINQSGGITAATVNIGSQDRHLDAALITQLEAGIARFKPREIRIQAIINDAEADQFALEIHDYLRSKGHNVIGDVDWAMFSRPIRGLVMQQTKEGNIALLIGNR